MVTIKSSLGNQEQPISLVDFFRLKKVSSTILKGKFCTYCKMTNYVIENDYKLIEFSADFKFTKGNMATSFTPSNVAHAQPHNNNFKDQKKIIISRQHSTHTSLTYFMK